MNNLNIHGANFYYDISCKLIEDKDLLSKWEVIMNKSSTDVTVKKLYDEVIGKYCGMSSAAFRKELIRELKITKNEAHRKQIKMSKSKSSVKFTFESIQTDSSVNKQSSHRRMQSEFEADASFLKNIMTKKQLQILCKAYEVSFASKDNKNNLEELLRDIILTSDSVPSPLFLREEPAVPSAGTSRQPPEEPQVPCAATSRQPQDDPTVESPGTSGQPPDDPTVQSPGTSRQPPEEPPVQTHRTRTSSQTSAGEYHFSMAYDQYFGRYANLSDLHYKFDLEDHSHSAVK
jgi:hypothetical protein